MIAQIFNQSHENQELSQRIWDAIEREHSAENTQTKLMIFNCIMQVMIYNELHRIPKKK